MLAAEDVADELGLPVRMRLVDFAFAGVEPEVMGIGPIPATEKALAQAGLTIDDIGLFEINEAFAVQVLAFLDHFGIADDDPRVNPWGGAIAIGHPLASSGVRLMTQLARDFEEHPEVRYGLTAMCVGIGMGGTRLWENPQLRGDEVSLTLPADPAQLKAQPGPFPDEVVTHAHVRVLDLPGGAGKLALITLDNGFDHTKPNTFGPGGLLELDDALDQVGPRPPTARSSRSASPASRSSSPSAPTSRASRVLQRPRPGPGHRPARPRRCSAVSASWPSRPSRSSTARPWAAASRSRCTAPTARSQLGRPGRGPARVSSSAWSPGWGGTHLLPRLIGPAKAVKVIIENALTQNQMLKGPQAFELGHRRRDVRAGRLPGGVAALGRAGPQRRRRRSSATELEQAEDWDAARRARPAVRRRQGARRRPRAVPGPGPDRRGPGPAPATRASPPRTRRWPT